MRFLRKISANSQLIRPVGYLKRYTYPLFICKNIAFSNVKKIMVSVQGEIVLMRLIIDSHPSIVTFTLQLFHYLIPAFLPIYYTVFEIVQFLKSIPIENLSSNCAAIS